MTKIARDTIKPQGLDLWFVSGLDGFKEEVVSHEHIKAFPMPDTEAVMEGCVFLRERVKEERLPLKERSAAIALLSHVAGKGSHKSFDITHQIARNWKGYNQVNVANEIGKSLAFGPRTCANVDKVSGENSVCKSCPHWGKINSPITIQGAKYVATETTGFHTVTLNEKGVPKKTPDYEGLRRYFYNEAPYVTIADSEETYRWNGKIWVPLKDAHLRGFAQAKFKPMADTKMVNEFINLVKRTELKDHDWFYSSTGGLMNFGNGVLDIKTGEFRAHSMELGFRTVLPYDYDPDATCPRFEQFLREVTQDRPELIDIILEFAGYSLSGDECWEQKAIVLLGEGQNGKSKLVSVIKALAGEGASTSQTFVDLEKDTNRAALDGSLFNIAEETPSRSLMDSSLFKALIGGAEVSVKKLYQQPYEIKNRAKFWMLCNEMPRTSDKAHALLRRLCIVPFDARFEGTSDDKRIEKKLMPELPGILNLVMRSYKNMLAREGLPESDIAKLKLEEYREDNDNVFRWFKECIEDLGPMDEYCIRSSELYDSYKKFTEDQGEKWATAPSFVRRLGGIWKPYAQRRAQKRMHSGGPPERVIMGIRIKQQYRVSGVRNFSVVGPPPTN